MADPRVDKLGKVRVPIASATLSTLAVGGSLAPIFDPALVGLLAAFSAILKTKLDGAWAKAATGMSTTIVASTHPYEPSGDISEMTWAWPALFMWRNTEAFLERTQVRDDVECTGKLALVLPPMPEAVFVKLESIRVAARTVLTQFIKCQGDPSYQSNANVLSLFELESFQFTNCQYGTLPAAAGLNMAHPCIDMTWLMRERQNFVSQYPALSTVAAHIWVEAESGSGETDLVDTTFVAIDP